MKKTTLLFLLALSGLSVSAQQTINFKIAYKPNTTYKQTVTQDMKMEMSYGEGMDPMVNEAKTTMINTTKTGKVVNGEIPFTTEIEIDKAMQDAGGLLQGTKMYGKITKDGKPQFDSISSKGMDERTKDMMFSTMKTSASQLFVAERKMKVGDSYVVDTPMDMPMGPVTIKMNTKTTYKLKKIEAGKGHFDMDQVVTMSTQVEGQDLKGSGSGKGTMVYDINNQYPTEFKNLTTMQMAMSAQGMDMNIKVSTDAVHSTVITAGK